jgi:hypothetical protein
MTDNRGTWDVVRTGSGIVAKTLTTPSESYLLERKIEESKQFTKPVVSSTEIQLANFILDITERLENLEGGSM